MSYTPNWSSGNVQGLLEGGLDWIDLSDFQELADALIRRRRLTCQFEQSFTSQLYADAPVRAATIQGQIAPPFDSLRLQLATDVLQPPWGSMGGDPPSPSGCAWLWPLADADENKTIVNGANGIGADQVELFQKLNGTHHWSDSPLSAGHDFVRAIHINELRQAVALMTRGRWVLPLYMWMGLFSLYPNSCWIGDTIYNNGANELRSLGYAMIAGGGSPTRGLVNVTVRPTSRIDVLASSNCTVDVYQCLRQIDFDNDLPTWNWPWSAPGGLGASDATIIGSTSASTSGGSISGPAVASAIQSMVNGAPQNFIIRRSNHGVETINITGQLVVEFDLNSPPN